MPRTKSPSLVPVEVAAGLTGLTAAAVREAIDSGRARSERIHKVLYVALEDLDEVAARQGDK